MLTKLSISSDLDSGQLLEQIEVQLYYQTLDQTPSVPIEEQGLVMVLMDQLHPPVGRAVRQQIYDHLHLQIGSERDTDPLWWSPIKEKLRAHLNFVLKNRRAT